MRSSRHKQNWGAVSRYFSGKAGGTRGSTSVLAWWGGEGGGVPNIMHGRSRIAINPRIAEREA